MAIQQKQQQKVASIERLIATSLEQIATILVRAGIALPDAERLLRYAFIRAAARAIESSGSKATQSQIATIAGVSRLEVRKFLYQPFGDAEKRKPNSRLESVVEGWSMDARYRNTCGKPRPLTFRGAKSEFGSLIRKYGRDVTAKTLRLQLIERGYAKIANGLICLQEDVRTKKQSPAASADLRFIASQLASIDFELGRRAYLTRRVTIEAPDKKTIRAIQRIAATRIEVALNSVASMSKVPRKRRKRSRLSRHRLLVHSTFAIEDTQ